MLDLTLATTPSPALHRVAADPGRHWKKAARPAIEAPPDDDPNPRPDAIWPDTASRSGICGAVSPRVVALADGTFRLYYTQILPRAGYPAGANDYENSSSRILSATSTDGLVWTPEPGVRMSPQQGGAGEFRVASSEVVPLANGRWRMYFECCPGSHADANSIRSAVSDDGLAWTVEPGDRMRGASANFASPRILFLDDGRVRLFCLERGRGIVSAVSDDGGTTFQSEPGERVMPGNGYDALIAFAPEIVEIAGGYVMYYAAYRTPREAYILRATSDDGLTWRKDAEPVIAPGPGGVDAAKCSEMCVYRLPRRDGATSTESRAVFGMLYEACDGVAPNARGVWRIALATSE